MARERAPAFQFYPKDFLTDSHVAAMTHEECGAYMRLLCFCWLEGSVESSAAAIGKLLRVKPKTVSRLWPALAPCFQELDGRLVQKRLERERVKQQAFRDLQTQRGKARMRGATRDNKGRMVSSRNPATLQPVMGGNGHQPASSSSISYLRTPVQPSKERSAGPAKPPPDPQVKAFVVWFQAEYKARRHGADYLVRWERDGALVKQMLGATTLERLKLLSQVMLSDKCADEFIIDTDRGIQILSTKFNWLSDRLAEWEAKRSS